MSSDRPALHSDVEAPCGAGDDVQPASEAEADGAQLPAGTTELSLEEAFELATKLHRQRRFDGARKLYERILALEPGHADSWCLLGSLEHQTGQSERALEHLARAIELVPGFAGYHTNHGNVLAEIERLDEALHAYRRAFELAPDSADVLNNIGAVQRALGRNEEAHATYRRALELDPRHPRVWNNLGLLYDALGRLEEATAAHLNALEIAPDFSGCAMQLGRTYYKLGRPERAAEVFRQWMVREPDNPIPAHMHAACSGHGVPDRASDAYVEAEFDDFAASFESVLNERLGYRAPRLVADLLGELLGPPARALDVLDVGCGTGLCGPLVAPWAQRLVGVDLSAGMLSRATTKGVYQHLVKAELTAFLEGTPGYWDAAVCADTLCYFGDLSVVMRAASRSLRPGAPLIFTVEALPDDGVDRSELQPHGRYAHGRAHLDRAVGAAGLIVQTARREVLRTEGGADVQGWLYAVRRPAD